MTKTKKPQFKYKVTFVESERGWGQRIETELFDTRAAAQKAIDRCNAYNKEQWEKTQVVPDWYMQANDKIEIVEI